MSQPLGVTAVRIDPLLLDAARRELDMTDAPTSNVIRHALALVGKVDPKTAQPRRGCPPGARRSRAA